MLHYTTQGQGNALILLHGFPTDGSTWQSITPILSKHFRVIIPDLPGAGKSLLPSEPLTVTNMAQAVLEVLDKENENKALVVGHSMGGYTALQLAAMQPDSIVGLSLVHSSAYADTDDKKENRRKAIRLIEKGRDGQEAFLIGAAPNMFSTDYADAHPEKLRAFVDKGMQLPGKNLTAFYEALIERNDNTTVLKNATFPIQWIIGGDDHVIPKDDLLEQASLSYITDVHLFKECGHLAMIEMPDELALAIEKFATYCYK